MKQQREQWGSGLRTLVGFVLAATFFLVPPGCDFGGPSDPGVGISNVTQAAPRLEEYDPTGQYTPYYTTADMGRPRYMHKWSVTQGGVAVVYGGSDERGFSGIDTAEFFDQSTWEKDTPRPESLAGMWIDTNLDGDPIAFENGPRMLFTVSPISGRFIIVGGSGDLLGGPIAEKAEFFDPDIRSFESLEADMVLPRFRHTAIKQNDGSILFTAGQIQSTVTVINDQIQAGFPGAQQQVTVFVTTPESEIYDLTEGDFRTLMLPGTNKPSKLNTPRGRAGHAMERIAGPDSTLSSADDVLLVVGGYQALSAQFAPREKQPGAVGRGTADGLTVLEFYDPLTQVFTQVGTVQLMAPRINAPHIMNMGFYNDLTIDGVRGLGNVVLVTHGNTDGACPVTTQVVDEMLVANFTGFGPAQGLQFFHVEDPQFGSHAQGIEYIDLDPALVVGRCSTNPLHMPRAMASAPGVPPLQTWIIALGGVHIVNVPPCVYFYQGGHPTVGAGCVFDPFFSLPAVQLGLSTRNLTTSRSRSNNPTGVVGCWLTLDGMIPTVDLSVYGTTPQTSRWGQPNGGARVWYPNIPLAGEDGILMTPDDRILLAGGGQDYPSAGGEPTTPSAEIFLPPGVNSDALWP